MPPVQAVRAANASLSLLNPVAIFVGGTSGIGEHTAYKLAQYSKNPQIHIVGRKQDAANRVIEELRKINGDGAYTFHQ
jgi:NAD(P)-dependent dehydrogenase (short-subunit alcohol dehydrogenase family)